MTNGMGGCIIGAGHNNNDNKRMLLLSYSDAIYLRVSHRKHCESASVNLHITVSFKTWSFIKFGCLAIRYRTTSQSCSNTNAIWLNCLFVVCVLLAGSTTTQPRNVFHRCKHIIVGCIGWSARAHNILFCSGTIAPSAEHASTNPHMGCRVVAFFFGKCARSFPHSLTSMCKTHRENMLFVCVWTDHCSWVLDWLMCCSTQISTYIARVRLPWLRIDWTTTQARNVFQRCKYIVVWCIG